MPAENREGDVLRVLRELGPAGGTVEDVASRLSMGARAVRRHLDNLQEGSRAKGETERHPPFRRIWRAL